MRTISLSEAKSSLNSLVASKETSILTKNGKAAATILPYELFQEMNILWEEKKHQDLIREAEEALAEEENLSSFKEMEKKYIKDQ